MQSARNESAYQRKFTKTDHTLDLLGELLEEQIKLETKYPNDVDADVTINQQNAKKIGNSHSQSQMNYISLNMFLLLKERWHGIAPS